jgi:hypothetical protein
LPLLGLHYEYANGRRRLVVIAVFCLCIGHPGFAFKGRKGKSDYANVHTTSEGADLLENKKTAYKTAYREESEA